MRDGVPGLGERTVGTHYFDWHHTEADTLDKVDPEDFRKNMAALAVMGYALADMPGRLVAEAGGGRRGPSSRSSMVGADDQRKDPLGEIESRCARRRCGGLPRRLRHGHRWQRADGARLFRRDGRRSRARARPHRLRARSLRAARKRAHRATARAHPRVRGEAGHPSVGSRRRHRAPVDHRARPRHARRARARRRQPRRDVRRDECLRHRHRLERSGGDSGHRRDLAACAANDPRDAHRPHAARRVRQGRRARPRRRARRGWRQLPGAGVRGRTARARRPPGALQSRRGDGREERRLPVRTRWPPTPTRSTRARSRSRSTRSRPASRCRIASIRSRAWRARRARRSRWSISAPAPVGA